MSKVFCLVPSHWTNKRLIDDFGEKTAYHIVHLNKGHDLTKAPNGEGSLLYDELGEMFGYEHALRNKAFFYTTDFRKKYGNWIEKEGDITLDKNGEPKLQDFLGLMGKAEALNKTRWTYRQEPQFIDPTARNYDSSKKSYSPILNKLSEQLNIPWEEANLNGEPAAYQDGKVLVDFNSITADSPFHEFMHPILLLMEVNNSKDLDRLVREALTDKKIVAKVDARYPNIEKTSREYRMELVATAVGEYAVKAAETVEAKGMLAAIKEFFQNFFKMMRNLMISDYSISVDNLSKLNLKEIGFLMGVKMPKLMPTEAQQLYDEIRQNAAIKKKDYVILKDLSRFNLEYLQDRLGWNAVEIVDYPSNENGKPGYDVRIYSPLTTKGERLYRRKEKETITPTDNKFFNNLILAVNEKANAKENELKSALSSQARHKTRIEAKYFRNLVNDIARFKTLDQALNVMQKEISKMNIRISRPQNLDDISSSLKLLNSFKKITESYGKDNTDPDIYNSIKDLNTAADRLYHRYAEKFTGQFKQEYLDKGGHQTVADSLVESIRDINALSLQTIGSSFGQNAIEQAVDHIIRLDAHEQNQKRREFMNELYNKLEAIGGDKADLSWMVEGDGIMLKTNPEFFKKQEEIRKLIIETSKATYELSKEIKTLEAQAIELQAEGKYREAVELEGKMREIKNKISELRRQGYTWDGYHKFMMQYFTYEMDDNKAAHFEEDMEILKEMYYYENQDGKLVLDKEAFQKAVESYNPLMFQDYLNGDLKYPNQGWKYFKLVPKADTETKLLNPKYAGLSDAQKAFYDFFVEKFAEASNNIYDQYMDDDMSHDALVRNFMSNLTEINERIGMLDSAKKWLGDLIPERDGAEELDIHGVYTGMNRKSIKFTPISAFLKTGVKMENQNILSAFEKFYDAGIASKYKSRVASLLESGKELAATMKRLDFDADGKMKTDLFGNPATISGRTKVSQRLEHIIEDYLTKDVYEDMFGNIKIAGKKLTGERIIDMVNDFTRFRQLGLNPFSGISNLMMGAANNWTYSKRNEFFTESELRDAYFKLKNNTLRYVTYNQVGSNDESLKIKLLAEQMGITRQLLEKKYGNVLDKAFTFQESGEFINQMASALAIMANERTKEALVGKGNKLVDRTGKEREILDLFKVDGQLLVLDGETFDLDALGINESKILTMSDAIMKVNKEIHGDYDQLNKMFLKRNALGRAAATFRTWLPQAMMQRFGKERSDYQLSAFYGEDIKRKGRYVSLVDVVKEKGWKGSFNMMGTFVTGFVPFVDGKISDELGLGKLDAANLNQTLSELRLFTNIFIATMVMGKVSDEDEELEDNSAFNFLYNMTARYENELSTFYYPTASYKLFKDAIPAFDTLEQLGDVLTATKRKIFEPEKDIYERGFRKGTSKLSKEIQLLLPVSKQIQNIWSTLNIQYEKTAYNNK